VLEEMAVKEMEEERRRRRRRGRVDGGGAHRHGAHLRGGAHRELVVERGHVDLAREGEHDDRRRRDGGEAGVEERDVAERVRALVLVRRRELRPRAAAAHG
jgi:hypothetical protein